MCNPPRGVSEAEKKDVNCERCDEVKEIDQKKADADTEIPKITKRQMKVYAAPVS